VLLKTETDTERRENVLAARFRDTERESAGVGLMARAQAHYIILRAVLPADHIMAMDLGPKPNHAVRAHSHSRRFVSV
jgi:hypothetical protein